LNYDAIVGNNGDDTIILQGGDETACGGGDDNKLGGNWGHDVSASDDVLQAGIGGDEIFIQFNDGTDGLFNVEFNNDDFNCWFGIKK